MIENISDSNLKKRNNNNSNNNEKDETNNNIADTNSNSNNSNNNEQPPIILKKKRHPLIITLRYVAMFLILFLLTNEYFIQFVHVEGALNKGKFSHINSQVYDPKDYGGIRIQYSPNYHELSADHLYDIFRNKSYEASPEHDNERDYPNNNINTNDSASSTTTTTTTATTTTDNDNNKENNNNNNNKEESNNNDINNEEDNQHIIISDGIKLFKNYDMIESNYASKINSNFTYVLFLYNMDCPFSHRLLPIVETLSRTFPNITFFQSRGFTIILKSHFHTRTTPTLFLKVNDNLVKYKGRKNLQSIKKWITDNIGELPLPDIKANPDIDLSQSIRADNGYLLYFSYCYVVFLIGCSIYRWLKKIPKMKTE